MEDQIRVPLSDFVREVAREAAHEAVTDLEKRVRKLEIGWARLIGFMAGSGLLGGAVGSLLSSAL